MLFDSRVLKSLIRSVLPIGILLTFQAAHSEYRVGGTLGLGGTGLISDQKISDVVVEVERSEGPGVFGIFLEYLTSDTTSVAVGHTRGFNLGPFSSGIGFTGVTWRKFFFGPAPSMVSSKEERSTLLIQRYALFSGVEVGVADGSTYRENDALPNASASGLFMGFHGGCDYQTSPGIVQRYEVVYSTTPVSTGSLKKSLTEFALQFGVYFIF
jgi:hypothetical protein